MRPSKSRIFDIAAFFNVTLQSFLNFTATFYPTTFLTTSTLTNFNQIRPVRPIFTSHPYTQLLFTVVVSSVLWPVQLQWKLCPQARAATSQPTTSSSCKIHYSSTLNVPSFLTSSSLPWTSATFPVWNILYSPITNVCTLIKTPCFFTARSSLHDILHVDKDRSMNKDQNLGIPLDHSDQSGQPISIKQKLLIW